MKDTYIREEENSARDPRRTYSANDRVSLHLLSPAGTLLRLKEALTTQDARQDV